MLERFTEMIKNFKKEKEDELMTFSLETVQGYFEMQDLNKWLKFNAITEKQKERADRFDKQIESILKKLYVPDYQSENV